MIILSLVIGHAELNVYKLIWKKSFAELEANAFAECMHVVHVLILYSDSLHSYNQRTRINGQIASHRGRSLDLLSAVWQTADNKCPVATVNCWVPSVAAADPELWWVGRKKRVIDWGGGGGRGLSLWWHNAPVTCIDSRRFEGALPELDDCLTCAITRGRPNRLFGSFSRPTRVIGYTR